MPGHFKKAIFAALFVLIPLAAQADSVITVTGQGTADAVLDEAHLTAGAVTPAQSAVEALAANREAMARVFAALKKLGVQERNIRTTNFFLQPTYAQSAIGLPQTREIAGYSVTNQVSVTLEDTSQVGTALDALIAAGANQASSVNFTIRDEKPLLAAARADAVKDAMTRAKTYADAAGVMLGQIQAITDSAVRPDVGPAFALGRTAPPPTPIGPGEQIISAAVTITWAIRSN